MHTIVLGAGGFVGTHLLQHLAEQGVTNIAAVYRSKPSAMLPASNTITWQQCDILDVDALAKIIMPNSQVYHCANAVSFESNDAQNMLHNNVEGTANVVNACLAAKVRKLVYVSSIAAIARSGEQATITENTPWLMHQNISVYGLSKYRAEMEVWRGIAEGLNAAIVNPSIILGEGNWHHSSCELFKNAYNEFPFYTKGSNGFVCVRDVVRAMAMLMQSDATAQRFILNQGNYTYQHITTCMATSMQRKPPHRLATPWMCNVVWRLYALRKMLIGKRALITKETAHTACSNYAYSSEKWLSYFPAFVYTPIETCIQRTGEWMAANMAMH